MSNLHKTAMEAVLAAAREDVALSLKDQDIADAHSEEADDIVLDVAILHAYRVFVRICEQFGHQVDEGLFADLAGELADEIAEEG
jgi:hypothetical protein